MIHLIVLASVSVMMLSNFTYKMLDSHKALMVVEGYEGPKVKIWLTFLSIPVVMLSVTIFSKDFETLIGSSLIIVLICGCLFLSNGIIMLSREQKTLGNSLALLVGVWLISTVTMSLIAPYFKHKLLIILSQSAVILCLIFIISFSIFCFFTLNYQRLSDEE